MPHDRSVTPDLAVTRRCSSESLMHLLSLLDLQRRARANAKASLTQISGSRADARSLDARLTSAEHQLQRPGSRA